MAQRTILFIAMLFLFPGAGCKINNDNISAPQPESEKELASFPVSVQGDYVDEKDNAILSIKETEIIKTYDYDYPYKVDNSHYLKGDSLFGKFNDEKEKVRFSGDTIIRHRIIDYAVFSLSKGNVLKTFRGHYFLNSCYSQYSWGVSIISVVKGVLTIQAIGNEIQIDEIKNMPEIPADTFTFDINSIKKSKGHFIENNYFGRSKYLRIR